MFINNAAFIAGVVAGIDVLLAFVVLHARWIVPMWFILPVGLVLAGSGGVAVGWAYAELRHRLPGRPWTFLAVVGVMAVILVPAFVLAELQAPVFTVTPAGPVQTVATSLIVARFVGDPAIALVYGAAAAACVVGLLLTRRDVFATAER